MKSYWCRFYVLRSEMGSFEYHGPWWESGFTMDEDQKVVIVAAVRAESEVAARKVLEDSFDPGHTMEYWDDANECEPDWEPFCGRFPRAEWMKWPWPVEKAE